MRVLLVLSCVVLAAVAEKATYNPKYDNFDVNTLLENDRLLKAYVFCFLDKGKCTAEGADFKKALPEAIETTCGKCTDKQKDNVRRVIKAIQQKHPKEWTELVNKNDPSGKNRDKFEQFIQGN